MSKRAAGALQARIFAAKLAKADSVISSAQLAAPESASTPIYYPARLYLALLLDCFHGNEELTASRGCGGSGTVSTRLSRPQAESSHRSRWGCSADVHRRVIVPIKLLNGGHCHFKSALGETSALCDKGPNTSLQNSPPITLSSGDSGEKGKKKKKLQLELQSQVADTEGTCGTRTQQKPQPSPLRHWCPGQLGTGSSPSTEAMKTHINAHFSPHSRK